MMGLVDGKERNKDEVEALLASSGFRLARLHKVKAVFLKGRHRNALTLFGIKIVAISR